MAKSEAFWPPVVADAELQAAEVRVLYADLKGMGFDVSTVGQLQRIASTERSFREALPALAKRFRSAGVRNELLSSMAKRPVSREVVDFLRCALSWEMRNDDGWLLWRVGASYGQVVSSQDVDDVLDFISDPRLGRVIRMLVLELGRIADSSVEGTLIALLERPDVCPNACRALSKIGTSAALPALRGMISSESRQTELSRNTVKFATRAVARIEARS